MDYYLDEDGQWKVSLLKRHDAIRDRRGSSIHGRPLQAPTGTMVTDSSGHEIRIRISPSDI